MLPLYVSKVFKKCLSNMRATRCLSHGCLRFSCGDGSLVLRRNLELMVPANDIYHDASALRTRLDKEGYLYFRNCISPGILQRTASIAQHHLTKLGVIQGHREEISSERSESCVNMETAFEEVTNGSKVVSLVSRIFGGAVRRFPHVSLDASLSGEKHAFHMDSVFMTKGTPLFLSVWVPLTNISLRHGPIVFAQESSSHKNTEKLRFSYGKYDAYSKEVEGNGVYSYDPADVDGLGSGMVTASMLAGDIVVFTGYTMHSFLTNQCETPRLGVETKWCLQADDVGPDARYIGHDISKCDAPSQQRDMLTLSQARETIWQR